MCEANHYCRPVRCTLLAILCSWVLGTAAFGVEDAVQSYLQQIMLSGDDKPSAAGASAKAIGDLVRLAQTTGGETGRVFAAALVAADPSLKSNERAVAEPASPAAGGMTMEQRIAIAHATHLVIQGLAQRLMSPGSTDDAKAASALLFAMADHSPSLVSRLSAITVLASLSAAGSPWCDPKPVLTAWDEWVKSMTVAEDRTIATEDRNAAAWSLMITHVQAVDGVMRLRLCQLDEINGEQVKTALEKLAGQVDAVVKACGEEIDARLAQRAEQIGGQWTGQSESMARLLAQLPQVRRTAAALVEAMRTGHQEQTMTLLGKPGQLPPNGMDIEKILLGGQDVHAGRLQWIIPVGSTGQAMRARIIMTATDRVNAVAEGESASISVVWRFKMVDGQMTVAPDR